MLSDVTSTLLLAEIAYLRGGNAHATLRDDEPVSARPGNGGESGGDAGEAN
jgi:hypothetical protein